jgi:hypothetical protein
MGMVAEKTIEIVKDSMLRCLAKPEFLDRFYDEFMKTPAISEKFRDTNMVMQKIVLKASLHLMLNAARGTPGEAMNKLAIEHDRGHRNIPRELYGLWLEAMVSAVKSTDVQCTNELELAWREVMQPGIDYMASRY